MTITDSRFRVRVLAATPNPQTVIWQAMHTDYAEGFVCDELPPTEPKAGEIVVKHLLAGDRGHYGPLEHVQIVFATAGFNHGTMQQARTHRVGVSFDVQSMRYTGSRIKKAANGWIDLEDVFYLRPVGEYRDRQGKKYEYREWDRIRDLYLCRQAATRYSELLDKGYAEEHARGILPFDYRQNFVVSFTLRALWHFFELRAKRDAQGEIQALCDMLLPHAEAWTPELTGWYKEHRYGRGRLAP